METHDPLNREAALTHISSLHDLSTGLCLALRSSSSILVDGAQPLLNYDSSRLTSSRYRSEIIHQRIFCLMRYHYYYYYYYDKKWCLTSSSFARFVFLSLSCECDMFDGLNVWCTQPASYNFNLYLDGSRSSHFLRFWWQRSSVCACMHAYHEFLAWIACSVRRWTVQSLTLLWISIISLNNFYRNI